MRLLLKENVFLETFKEGAAASERKMIFFMLKQICGCFWKYFMFFKERAAASERYQENL